MDDRQSMASAIAVGTEALATELARIHPDVVLVVGDRFELLSVASATTALGIPLAHVHGGELTEGAFDESIRHAVTKLSHVHFASADVHARRILQLGEEPWRVFVTGAPALDEIADFDPIGDQALEERIQLPLDVPPLLVTYHAPTLDELDVAVRLGQLLAALDEVSLPLVFTYPNADPGNRLIRRRIGDYIATHESAVSATNLWTARVLLDDAGCRRDGWELLLRPGGGTILPAPCRQRREPAEGRLRAANVIDAADDRASIVAAIRRATSSEFRASLSQLVNPYGTGHASERIVDVLRSIDLGPSILVKRFQDADV